MLIPAEIPIRLLDVLDEEDLVITKDGRPIARIVRIDNNARGPMYGSVKILGDIVEPVVDADEWTFDEDNLK